MTIKLPQPSMALNEEGIDNNSNYAVFQMWHTWTVGKNTPVEHIVEWVAAVADSAPDHYLRVLAINAHGSAAVIHLGEDINAPSPVFTQWRNKVANIWVMSCETAQVREPPAPGSRYPPDWNNGDAYCGRLAKLTGAYVVASASIQDRVETLPWGCVPDWQGEVFRYEPEYGSVDWRFDYSDHLLHTFDDLPPIGVPPRFRESMGGAGSFGWVPRKAPWYHRPGAPPFFEFL